MHVGRIGGLHLRHLIAGSQRSVTPVYRDAANTWLAGHPLYGVNGTGFIYFPQSAVLFMPLGLMSKLAANVVSRIVFAGIYAWGLQRLARMIERFSPGPLFSLLSLVSITLSWSSLQNGQATIPMAGLMMAAVANLADSRFWRAAGCLALAMAFKPLALVLMLLAPAAYRPMRVPAVVAVLAFAAVPFLAQHPGYVQSQYTAAVHNLQMCNEHSNLAYFAQPFSVLRIVGYEVPEDTQTALRGVFAIATLAVCLYFQRRLDAAQFGLFLFGLAACYLMLFNPRTENNTYSLLAPSIAAALAKAVRERRAMREILFLVGVAAGVIGSYEVGRMFTPPAEHLAGANRGERVSRVSPGRFFATDTPQRCRQTHRADECRAGLRRAA